MVENQIQTVDPLEFTKFDLMHLEALDCIREKPVRDDLREVLTSKIRGRVTAAEFLKSPLGKHVTAQWKLHKLDACSPTSIGLVVGLHVADELTGTKTAFEIWG